LINPEINEYGSKVWRDTKGRNHRDDGPAVVRTNGVKVWCQHGMWHRADGPAIEYADGRKSWYIHGQEYSVDEWLDVNPDLTHEEKVIIKLQYG
jgi:hypothetical protein